MKTISRVLVLLFFIANIANPSMASAEAYTVIDADLITPAFTTGVDDQDVALVSSVAGVNDVRAMVLVNIVDIPLTGDFFTVGNCDVHFNNTLGSTSNDLDCSGDNAVFIDLTADADDRLLDAMGIRGYLNQISNATDPNQGSISTDIDNGNFYFRGELPVATTTPILTVSIVGKINLTSSPAVIGTVQQNVYEFTGTLEDGDIINFETSYTSVVFEVSGETTWTQVADTVTWEIKYRGDNYSSELFTVTAVDNTIVFTAKSASDDLSSINQFFASNRAATLQNVLFTVNDVLPQTTYVITINGIDYEYASRDDSTVVSIAEALKTLLGANSDVSCTGDIDCVGNVLSVPFTYSVNYFETPRIRSGGGSSKRIKRTPTTPVEVVEVKKAALTLRDQILFVIEAAEKAGIQIPQELRDFINDDSVIRNLTIGDVGDDVSKLQQILITFSKGPKAEALTKVGATGYFGPLTQATLAEWQVANGVTPDTGYFGVHTREKMKNLGLAGVWW